MPSTNKIDRHTKPTKKSLEDEDTLAASESFAAIPYASKILLTNL